MIILAIDLGKFNSMCCFSDGRTGQHRFQAAPTTREYFESILKNRRSISKSAVAKERRVIHRRAVFSQVLKAW